MEPKIEWLGHDSFRITAEKNVYIDSWENSEGPPADVILITHDHFDHFVKEDIDKVRDPNTVVVAPEAAAKQLEGKVQVARRGEKLNLNGVPVEVVPAYNVHPDRLKFHPKEYGGEGSVGPPGGERIYHTGVV